MTPYSPPLDAAALRAMYPESDRKPMADNTSPGAAGSLALRQPLRLLRDDDRASSPPTTSGIPSRSGRSWSLAPDVYVVFGRPKGDRGSYMQWQEDGIPLTVASRSSRRRNTKKEMARKLRFYDRYGVEEYYVYDPDRNTLEIHIAGQAPPARRDLAAFVSPRLGIRFEMTAPEMTVYRRDGRPFLSSTNSSREAEAADEAPARAPSRRVGPQGAARPGDAGRGGRTRTARGGVRLTPSAPGRLTAPAATDSLILSSLPHA